MLIHRNALSAVLPAAAKDDTSGYSLNGICVEPDGAVAATNGHLLLTARSSRERDDNYPVKGVPEYRGDPDGRVLINRDDVQRLIKAIPKKTTIPVLEYAQLTKAGNNGHVTIAATDLSSVHVTAVDTSAQASFPNYAKLEPAADRPEVTVTLAIDVLEALIKGAKAIGAVGVTLGVPTTDADAKVTTALRVSMRGRLYDPSLVVSGLAMPMRL
jgi:hypothetical protein